MTIHVGNLRTSKTGRKCDRTSPLGNPFWMRHESQRENVCNWFGEYFHLVVDDGILPVTAIANIQEKNPKACLTQAWNIPTRELFIRSLDQIKDGETILCWCNPKRCHLATVKQFLEQRFSLMEIK